MSIIFTKHALERIKARGVDKNEVFDALENPENLVEKSGVKIVQKKVGNQLLRVYYREEKKAKIIILLFEKYINQIPPFEKHNSI